MSLCPTSVEAAHRDRVRAALVDAIRAGVVIRLPAFDPGSSPSSRDVALQFVGAEPNPFGGRVGAYLYQLEGEEDLLHLIVTRADSRELVPEEAREVAAFLFPDFPAGLMWLKPGRFSQHFYVAHDELLPASSRPDPGRPGSGPVDALELGH